MLDYLEFAKCCIVQNVLSVRFFEQDSLSVGLLLEFAKCWTLQNLLMVRCFKQNLVSVVLFKQNLRNVGLF